MGNAIHQAISEADDFLKDKHGIPYPNVQPNIWLALTRLDVGLSHDLFADRSLVTIGDAPPKHLDDPEMNRLWLEIDRTFGFRPGKEFFITVLQDVARRQSFHPVQDYLNGLIWDGKKRIDSWLIDYSGADDTKFVRSVGALLLVAAVRRIRHPGAKFDEMVVLEGGQGTLSKSSAIAALCPNAAWFTDDLPLNSDSKQVIERTKGRWIIEAAELDGLRKQEVEHLKAFLSRQTDIARMAYDRVTTERPRHFVVIGTTNHTNYLRDMTGNRRFWPVSVKGFDVDKLTHDRNQLWAEAAHREATGASIRLNPSLWEEAGHQQEARRTADPWEEILIEAIGQQTGRLPTEEVWRFLSVPLANRNQVMNARVGTIMRTLGFERKKLRPPGGEPKWHYVRGAETNIITI